MIVPSDLPYRSFSALRQQLNDPPMRLLSRLEQTIMRH